MEKISRILPPSPRVTSADLRNSGVARPGAPSFGRPVGVSALATPRFDGMARASEELREFRAQREPTYNKDPKSQIVERISREFFSKAPKTELPTTENGVSIADEIIANFHDGDSDLVPVTGKLAVTELMDLALSAGAPEETLGEDAPLVGGQLDVMA